MTEANPNRPPETPWSFRVRLDEVPEAGRRIELAADEETRVALAVFIGLRSLPKAAASFDVRRHGRDGLHVTGEVTALVGQTCVVTLEPMESEIREPVDVLFRPAGDVPRKSPAEAAETDEEDPPELLVDGAADLGALATEFLILGIDPYPRKDGAVFEPPPGGSPEAGPFAALARLKGRTDSEK